MKDGEKVVFVEIEDGKPFAVTTQGTDGEFRHYEFDWCKRDQFFLYCQTGNALYMEDIGSRFFATDEALNRLLQQDYSPYGERLPALPAPYTPENLFDGAKESRVYWCVQCADFLPRGEKQCSHVEDCV